MSYSVCLSICLPPAAAFHPYCQQGFGNNFRRKYTQSRVICQSVVVKVAIHVCKSGPSVPVVLHIVPHVCKSWVSAPVIPLFHCHGCRSWVFAPVVGFMCANPDLLPPSVFMDVVPNCVKGPLCSGCFASGIPQGRHLQMPGRSWRAGKAVWRWKARRP